MLRARELKEFNLTVDVLNLEEICIQALESKVKEISSAADEFLKLFLTKPIASLRAEYDKFTTHYENLISELVKVILKTITVSLF